MTDPITNHSPSDPGTDEAGLREYRVKVRDCIGETIPLRRRWVSAIVARVVAPILAELAALRLRVETVTRERDEARASKGEVGPHLWGRHPKTRRWHHIDDGTHTDEEVAEFEKNYSDAGWTDLRRTSPFRERADMRLRTWVETAEARAAAAEARVRDVAANAPVEFLQAVQRSTNLPDKYRDAAGLLLSGAISNRSLITQEARHAD